MNKKLIFCLLLTAVFFLSCLPSFGQSVRDNPSFYSVAEIVQNSPKMWMANPTEVTEMMKKYPDFTCWRGSDTIGCQSNNNRNCAEIYLSLGFSSNDDYAEFDHITFSMQINSTEDIQKVVESFWLEDMQPAKIMGADYQNNQVTMYFSTENTMMKISVPFGESGVWVILAEIGFVRG